MAFSDRLAPHRIPPIKMRAIEALARGPIRGSWNGHWHDANGDAYNFHTVSWIASIGFGALNAARTELRATGELFQFLRAEAA